MTILLIKVDKNIVYALFFLVFLQYIIGSIIYIDE